MNATVQLNMTTPTLPLSPFLANFVCTSRACQVDSLTAEEKATVVATATATTTVAATIIATSVASAGAPAAIPLAFALQRAVLFTNIGGAPAAPTLAAVGEQMQWVQGRFDLWGVGGYAASSRLRRLQKGGSGGSGGGGGQWVAGTAGGTSSDKDSSETASEVERLKAEDKIRISLLTSLSDLLTFLPCFAACHMLLLASWRRCTAPRARKGTAPMVVAPRAKISATLTTSPSPPSSPPASYHLEVPSRSRVDADVTPEESESSETGSPYSRKGATQAKAQAREPFVKVSSKRTMRMEAKQRARDRDQNGAAGLVTAPLPAPSVAGLAARSRPPRALPSTMVFPNLEVVLLNFFAGGLTEASAACISGYAVGLVQDVHLFATALCCLIAILGFYVHEFCRLRHFHNSHAGALWTPAPTVQSKSEMDDPVLRTMAKLSLARHPSLRLRGSFEPSKGESLEPYRTLRLLSQPTTIRKGRRAKRASEVAGDKHAELHGWLADSAGKWGIYYQFIRTAATLLVAFITGAAADGAINEHAVVITLIVVQMLTAIYCLCSTAAADQLEGNVSGIEATACGLNVALLYVSAQMVSQPALATNVTSTTDASLAPSAMSSWQLAGLVVSIVAVAFPLVLTFYDSIVLPAIELQQKESLAGKQQGYLMICCRSTFVLPMLLLTTLTESGASLNAMAEVVEDVTDSAIQTGTPGRCVLDEESAWSTEGEGSRSAH